MANDSSNSFVFLQKKCQLHNKLVNFSAELQYLPAMSEPPSLMLCMEKDDGEEITFQIHPKEDFSSFLVKARARLGYDIDLNSITHNHPVALTDNMYNFLVNTDLYPNDVDKQMPVSNNEDLYILDDGTQICASQIHFDNEDPPVDLTAEKIPFVKIDDAIDDAEVDDIDTEKVLYNIVDSPVRFTKDGSLVIPFKLVNDNFPLTNNQTGFEAQFTKFLEAKQQMKTYATLNTVTNRNKSPRSLIRDNFKNLDESYKKNTDDLTHFTREDILNMFKDAPVPSIPYENQSFPEKRRHVRKTDPSRSGHKTFSTPSNYVEDNGVLIAESESQNCFICAKFVDHNHEKLYLFDNEDQRLHRSSPQKKLSTQLKIICELCLSTNFKPCRKSPNQSLNPDEYLVIRNNQQYIFQKNSSLSFDVEQKFFEAKANLKKTIYYKKDEQNESLKVEIGSDGEIVSQSIQKEITSVKRETKESSSDVEIVENDQAFDDIDNLEEADEEVIEFLGKCQFDNNEVKELKCRFCKVVFKEVSEVIDHGEVHKHVLEEDEVFPCPLCDYGYANLKWLKGHLKAAHERMCQAKCVVKTETDVGNNSGCVEGVAGGSPKDSPIARRTRSATTTKVSEGDDKKESPEKPGESQEIKQELKFEIQTEVKQETLDSSDEEIWIVQATREDDQDKKRKSNEPDKHQCSDCKQIFISSHSLSQHKCRRRKPKDKDMVICVRSKEDFIRSAQGRMKNVEDSGEDDLLTARPSKKSTDLQIVTCHNCNESFTSKVRLKFHMQFHDPTNPVGASGEYTCTECTCAKFATETELFDHVHFQHHKKRRWQCPVVGCHKTFYLRATLTKHSRTHTDTRRYVCGTCGKRFLDKQTLDEHGVTHLQIKPFQCHFCLKQLTRRSRLRMHLRAHEEEMCLRLVLVCAVCSRAFRDHHDVQEHLTRSPECIKEFLDELKEEEAVSVQLSPTSGLVRHAVGDAEPAKLSRPIYREVVTAEAEALLATVPDAARPITRCVEIEKAFRCEYCEDVFYSESGLNTHRVIHKSVKSPFTCHICKVSFTTYSRCTTHKTTHGFYKRSLAASKADGQQTSSTGILGYGDFPVVKHFLCEDCGRSYLHWTYLQVHRRMKHATDNPYKCTQCELTFTNSWSLLYHRKKQHGKTETEDNNANKKLKEDYRIPCRDCDEVLPNKTALYKHRKKEHSDPTLQPGEDYANAANSNNSDPNPGVWRPAGSEAPAPATEHSAQFKIPQTQELCFECPTCHKMFLTRTELTTHARTHAPRRSHTCSVCGHGFRTHSMLAEHARVHSGERPFPCDVCGVAFRRSTAMRNHRLIHSGVRAFPCARCPKRFRIRSDLRAHARLKHPANIVVIEVAGLNPSPEDVMEQLTANDIAQDRVIEITKMSFPKGVSSVIPSSARALEMLARVPQTQVATSRTRPNRPIELYQSSRRGRGIAKNPRKPKLPTSSSTTSTPSTPISSFTTPSVSITTDNLSIPLASRASSVMSKCPMPKTSYPMLNNYLMPNINYTMSGASYSMPNLSYTMPSTSFTMPSTSYTKTDNSYITSSSSYTTSSSSYSISNNSYSMPNNSFKMPNTSYTTPSNIYTMPKSNYTTEQSYPMPSSSFSMPNLSMTDENLLDLSHSMPNFSRPESSMPECPIPTAVVTLSTSGLSSGPAVTYTFKVPTAEFGPINPAPPPNQELNLQQLLSETVLNGNQAMQGDEAMTVE